MTIQLAQAKWIFFLIVAPPKKKTQKNENTKKQNKRNVQGIWAPLEQFLWDM